jgi:IS605 OrfB family transposase
MSSSRSRLPTRVVAPPVAVSVGSRLQLTDWEQQLLVAVGAHLSRARAADLAAAQRREPANDRQRRLSAGFGIRSRYAGSICVDNDAAVRAAKEQLWSHQVGLQAAVRHLEARTALPSRAAGCGCRKRRCDRCGNGYATENERVMKRRRLDVLRGELVRVQRRRAEGRYSVCLGGRRLAITRQHLEQAGLTEQDWRQRWQRQRAWFGCVGNTGKPGGNPCLSLRQDDPARPGQWFLTVSVPAPLRARFGCGSQVRLTHPVPLHHRREELEERLHARRAVRLDIDFTTDRRGREKVMLRVAWLRPQQPALTLQQARLGGLVGVDLNADHLAAARLDQAGNPVGRPVRIPLELDGLPASLRDARLREAITALLRFTRATGARAIAVEELGFTGETTREKHGRNRRFRRLLSGFPTGAFRTRLTAMATTAGLAVITVDPRYTSKIGGRDWQRVLTGGPTANPTSQTNVTRHEGAAVAIGRRALALGLTAGPRGPERRSAPHQRRHPGTRPAGRGDGSTSSPAAPVRAPGTPTRPITRDRAGARAARRTPAAVSAPAPPVSGGRGPGETTRRTGRTPRIGSAAPPARPG